MHHDGAHSVVGSDNLPVPNGEPDRCGPTRQCGQHRCQLGGSGAWRTSGTGLSARRRIDLTWTCLIPNDHGDLLHPSPFTLLTFTLYPNRRTPTAGPPTPAIVRPRRDSQN